MNRPTPPASPGPPTTAAEVRRALRFLGRALRLRCPECGISPMYVPLARTRSLDDWVTPLDGCPRCGYAYKREAGYFLLAIWGVHYFTVTGLGLLTGLLIDIFFTGVPIWLLILCVCLPTLAFGFLFIRHAKAVYLAIDHFFDPHVKPR